MNVVLSFVLIYLVSFILFFAFIYTQNKKEDEVEKTSLVFVLFISFLFAFIPTAVLGFFLFVIVGSVSSIKWLFSLPINTNQLIILSIAYLIYLLTIDSLIEILAKVIFNETIFHIAFVALTRMLIFYIIGEFNHLPYHMNMIISIGVALILFCIESLHFFREQRSE